MKHSTEAARRVINHRCKEGAIPSDIAGVLYEAIAAYHDGFSVRVDASIDRMISWDAEKTKTIEAERDALKELLKSASGYMEHKDLELKSMCGLLIESSRGCTCGLDELEAQVKKATS